jgi:hypothetical protein
MVSAVEKEYVLSHDGNLLVASFLSSGLNNLTNARGANLLLLEGFVGTHWNNNN